MIVIDTSPLNFSLNAAHTTEACNMHVSYRNINPTSPSYIPQSVNVNSDGTTEVIVLSAPPTDTYSLIDFISFFNADSTTTIVTIKIGAMIINKVQLNAGERLEYAEGKGWTVYNIYGSSKTVNQPGIIPSNNVWNTIILDSDVVNNNATANSLRDVGTLNFNVNAGNTYYFRFIVMFTAAATTTGSRWVIDGPTASNIAAVSTIALTSTSISTNNVSAYNLPVASSTSSANVGGNIAVIEGFIKPTNGGPVKLRFASEVANSAITAKAGSLCEWYTII